jgi:UPF0716 family protein affecting phage T7 exclusion
MKATVNKVQTITIIFVYAVVGVAFFYVNGIETTGRTIETIPYPQKLNNTILVTSGIIVVAIGLLIFYGRK